MRSAWPPYFAVRRPWLVAGQLTGGCVIATLLATAQLPVTRIVMVQGYGLGQTQTSGAARMAVAIPALVAAATWNDPTGDLVMTSSRRLTKVRIAHLALVAGVTAVGTQIVSTAETVNRVQVLANGLIFLAAALLSVVLFGLLGMWVIPVVLLMVPVIRAPLPTWLASWPYDASSAPHRLIVATVALALVSLAALKTAPHPLLRARSSAERNNP